MRCKSVQFACLNLADGLQAKLFLKKSAEALAEFGGFAANGLAGVTGGGYHGFKAGTGDLAKHFLDERGGRDAVRALTKVGEVNVGQRQNHAVEMHLGTDDKKIVHLQFFGRLGCTRLDGGVGVGGFVFRATGERRDVVHDLLKIIGPERIPIEIDFRLTHFDGFDDDLVAQHRKWRHADGGLANADGVGGLEACRVAHDQTFYAAGAGQHRDIHRINGEAGLRDLGPDGFHARLDDVTDEEARDDHHGQNDHEHADARADENFLFHINGKLPARRAFAKPICAHFTPRCVTP